MGVVDAIKVGLWPTHLHVSNGLPQRAVVGILRVATIALGLKQDRSRILKVCRPPIPPGLRGCRSPRQTLRRCR